MKELESGLKVSMNEVVKDFRISFICTARDEMTTRVKIWKNLTNGRFSLIPELTLRLPNEYSGFYTLVAGDSEEDVISKFILETEKKLVDFHRSMCKPHEDSTNIVVNQEWLQPNKCWLE